MENDTDIGGESLSIEQAAAAFVKQSSNGAEQGQPEEDIVEEGEQADDELQASDEDVSEDDGEPEEEGQAQEEDDAEPESDQGRFVAANGKVKLPDGTVSTVADLIQGNLRDRDYRQKTMQAAELKRQAEERSSALQASEQQVNEQREYMSRLMEWIAPPPPDPTLMDPKSEHYDPLGYMHAKDQYERFAGTVQQLQQQMGMVRQQTDERTQKQRLESASAEWERLQEVVPDLKDQAKAKAFAADIQSAGQAAGFSPQEIVNTVPFDHRMALVLRKAAQWDRLQASKPKVQQKVQGRPPVHKSGKRLSPEAHRTARASDAMTRLKQSGAHDDAVAAYLATQKG